MDVSMHLKGRVEIGVHGFEADMDNEEFVHLTVRDGPYPMGAIHFFFHGSKQQLLDFANDIREAALNIDADLSGLGGLVSESVDGYIPKDKDDISAELEKIIQPIAQSYDLGQKAVYEILEKLT
jgi:hypothetical protein